MRDKLTRKQEGYAQDRASGLAQSAAYRNNYDTSNMAAKTVHEAASRLDKNYKVTARVLELQVATETALAEKRLWDVDRLVEEAEANLHGAREGKQVGPANRALEFIGKVTGLLDPKHQEPQAAITRINIIMPPGAEPPAGQLVESSYRELPGPAMRLPKGHRTCRGRRSHGKWYTLPPAWLSL